MAEGKLAWTPAHQIAESIRRGERSAREVTLDCLDRIEASQPALNAFITVSAERALDQADAIDACAPAERTAALLGAPFSAKDNVFTKGVRTTMASKAMETFQPHEDAVVVARLATAGGVLVGKANLPEFSMWGRSGNLVAPECRNPWDRRRTCGGSSGGSGAAVAAGLVPISIGTDDGGSIRLPAALNGVFGLYPSPRRVPLDGVVIGGRISAAGPITRDVRDAALFLDAMAPGNDFAAGIDRGVAGMRMAWAAAHESSEFNDTRVVEVARQAALALARAGAVVEELEIFLVDNMGATPSSPFPDLPSYGGLRPFDLPEVVRFTAEPDWRERLAPNARPGSLLGDEAGAGTAETEERRRRVVDQMRGIHEHFDVLLTPTIDQIAPPIPDDWSYPYGPPGCSPAESVRQYVKYTMRANLAGCVAASVPAGFVDGMPVGLQVIGRPGEEQTVLRVARALEQILPWAEKRPPIVDGV